MENSRRGGAGVITGSGLESTSSLLTRLRAGDESAREVLVARYLPALTRWAHSRLPSRCRDLQDTDDLVQITLLRAFSRMQDLEYRGRGGLLAYLRRILLNRIQDEIRRVGRTPPISGIDLRMPDAADISPLEKAIGRERLEAYERALATLPTVYQEAIVMRVELGFTYGEIGEAIGSPSANAARMVVLRAVARLAEALHA